MKARSGVKKLTDDDGNYLIKSIQNYAIKSSAKSKDRPEDYNYLVPWMLKDEQIKFKNEK